MLKSLQDLNYRLDIQVYLGPHSVYEKNLALETRDLSQTDTVLTVACIIVRRLLISVHKLQSSGMADTHEYWSH